MSDQTEKDAEAQTRIGAAGLSDAAKLGYYSLIVWAIGLVGWSIAAGSWRAIKTVLDQPSWKALLGFEWLSIVAGAFFYSVGALACMLLILIAAWLVGGAFGVLFGLPRMEPGGESAMRSERSQSVSTAEGATPPVPGEAATLSNTTAASSRLSRFRVSPALNEIADWLTKIIVGVGLVQAEAIGSGFIRLNGFFLHEAGLVRFPAAGIAVPCCMISGLIAGFIVTYHFMALIMGPRLADAGYETESSQLRREKTELKKERDDERKRSEEAYLRLVEAQKMAETAVAAAETEAVKLVAVEAVIARVTDFAAVVRQWKDIDMDSLMLPPGVAPRPEVTDAAKDFAGRSFRECDSVDEKRAWVRINVALGNLDDALAANRTLGT